jgi:hypothetical protein
MTEPTQLDWARLAAFLDGEGSIRVARQIKNKATQMHWPIYTLLVAVDNTDLRLMSWLTSLFGGTIDDKCHKNRAATGRRQLYRWRATKDERRVVLENCMPYFILKRKQAELGLQMLLTTTGTRPGQRRPVERVIRQEAICSELNALNLTRGKNKQATLAMVQ